MSKTVLLGTTQPYRFHILQWLKYLSLFLGLSAYYAENLAIVPWTGSLIVLILFFKRTTLGFLGFAYVLTFYFLARFILESGESIQLIQDIRYFWGFILFYIFFLSEHLHDPAAAARYRDFFRTIVNIFIVLLFVELITSNLFYYQWPNREHDFFGEISAGTIARAYGFGGNATVTSVLIISLTAVLYQSYIRDILALGMSTSGTGWILLLAKFILRRRRLTTLAFTFPLVAFVLSFSTDIANTINYPPLDKLSINYFIYIWEFKLNQINSTISQIDLQSFCVGQSLRNSNLRTGDFQALVFFLFNGLIGTILFFIFVLTCTSKNYISVILLLVGTIHYQVIFSLPGQIIFAWILSLAKLDNLKSVAADK